MTWVPSRGPLIATALASAPRPAVFSIPIESTGHKNGAWQQHTMASQAERLARICSDWAVDGRAVAGRSVLLIDDVFVTGASMLSYAAALLRAGAVDVRAIAVSRHIRDTHSDYFDALRIVRRTGEWVWDPTRARVA